MPILASINSARDHGKPKSTHFPNTSNKIACVTLQKVHQGFHQKPSKDQLC